MEKSKLTSVEQEGEDREFETRNFNGPIWVRMTDRGREILKEKGITSITEDEEGWSKMTHHDLLSIFGKYMTVGSFADSSNKDFQLPVEPEYRIKK